jgi:glyoxylate utilization-related uncharacterized protein
MIRTRGHRGRAYTLLTPDNHYASRLPNLPGASVFKLVTPRLAPARLAQYLLAIGDREVDAEVGPGFENFFFGLEGSAEVRSQDGRSTLGARAYAYVPAQTTLVLAAQPGARLLWIKRAAMSRGRGWSRRRGAPAGLRTSPPRRPRRPACAGESCWSRPIPDLTST